ncbi:hypothetical protein OG365_15340 [Streptomyces sp. NBC_00853]|uniref:hypothetical protein n=1 Tax=Streptomyces sp. NBC_00853 TaxID=2903681 RepID=UPI003873030F|nr:hypothetical protein OG365_15340 [Streptomyces sp. NBC_00853]
MVHHLQGVTYPSRVRLTGEDRERAVTGRRELLGRLPHTGAADDLRLLQHRAGAQHHPGVGQRDSRSQPATSVAQ